MANTGRVFALALVAGAILAGPHVSARVDETIPNLAAPSHVRSFSPFIASVIQLAGERSPTFRRLVETINASDSYVYVDEGECRDSDQRACLVNVTVGGPYRSIFVHVATHGADWDLMASIGHELHHTIEVIDNRFVTSLLTMRVRDEVRAFIRRTKP